jgi:hypothetical protein
MSVVSLLTTAIKPLLKKGLPKRRVAELILDSGNFSKPSVFRPNRKYSGSFDKAWKEAGGKKYTQTESGKIAAAAKKKLYEENPAKAASEYGKISKKFLDDIESGKRTTPWMEQIKTTAVERNKADTALDFIIKNKVKASEPEQKGLLSILRNILYRRLANTTDPNAKRNIISQLTKQPTMQRYLKQIQDEGYVPQLNEVGEVVGYMRGPKSAEEMILNRIAQKSKRKPDYKQRGTYGHEAGLKTMRDNLTMPNKLTDEIAQDFKDTSKELLGMNQLLTLKPEQGLINIAKDSLDNLSAAAIRSGEATPKGLAEFSKLYDMAGITSLMPGIKGKAIRLGKDLPLDASRSKQIDYMNKAIDYDLKPFYFDLTDTMRSYAGYNRKPSFTMGFSNKMNQKRNKLLQEVLRGNLTLADLGFPKFSKGGKIPSYAAGGIGRLGAKLLQKLIGKLSNKELQMILDTSFKGTKPLMSPAKIRQAKLLRKLGPDRYRWRNVKSEVPGPKTSLQRMQEEEFFKHSEFWPYKGMGE